MTRINSKSGYELIYNLAAGKEELLSSSQVCHI